MLRLTIVLALATATGCTKRQQDFAWFAAAVALEVAAHSAAHSAERAPVAVAAPDPDDPRGPTDADLQRAHDVAYELTRIAAHDARIDNCDAVVRTSKHVEVIDAAVFVNVFLADAAIQRCLTATSSAYR